jgi:hypothetical protein
MTRKPGDRRGAYQSEWAKGKKKVKETQPKELESTETQELKPQDAVEESTTTMNQGVMERIDEDEEEMDLEALSAKFVREPKTQPAIKDDAPNMVIKPPQAVEVIQKWCSGQLRAGLIIGTNELATLITLGSYSSRLPTAKIDTITANIISGGEKAFNSQPCLNNLKAMGLVSRKPIEGTRAYSYALTDLGITLATVLAAWEGFLRQTLRAVEGTWQPFYRKTAWAS